MHFSPDEKNSYLLTLENKMKTPYRKLMIKRGVNAFEILEIISVATENFQTKVLQIKVHMSCRIKSTKYFSQKINTSEIVLIL